MRIYAYLRASTNEQDATRAKEDLDDFVKQKNLSISSYFLENESGAKLDRPELFRLLAIAEAGDILLVEQVDRISRLNTDDWEKLKTIIKSKSVRVVSIDLPTSHQLIQTGDEFTQRMLTAINDLMLDMLAAVARKDYVDRRRRQAQGISKAKQKGLYRGRPENTALLENIQNLLISGFSYTKICEMLDCSRPTVAKVSKRMKQDGIKKKSEMLV
jgi:DNA invertase Pin-like site-specific DNA recombinase